MEKETTYRKVAVTRYTFTADDIKWALMTQYVGLDPSRAVGFCVVTPPDTEFYAQIVVERTVDVDDTGPVMVAT